MTGCRASTCLAVAALLLVAAGSAQAQQGPIRLAPPLADTVPTQAAPDPAAATGESVRQEPPTEILVGAPPPLDIDGIGLVDEARGGLPATLWTGSDRAVVDRLIAQLPASSRSPAARSLAERVLISGGPPPAAGTEKPKQSFAVLRAARLMTMGQLDAAARLARAIPRREEDPVLSRILLDAALVNYDNAGACDLVRRQIGKNESLYFQKALIFCQALNGEHGRAQLGLTMLREQRADEDESFAPLVYALGGDQRAVTELAARPTPLHLAMVRAARQTVPAGAADNAEPAVLRMIATSPNASAETRLAAAVRAEAAGTLSAEQLAQIFEAASFSAEESADLLALAESAAAPRAQAAIYRAAKAQVVGVARAEALARGWRIARARGFYPAAARAASPLVAELSPAPELAWFAGEAGRALLLAGRRDEARRWQQLARDEAAVRGRSDQSELLLAPLMRLAGVEAAAPSAQAVAAWRAAQEKLDAKAAPGRLATLTALLEGLGDGTDGSLAALLLAGDLGPQSVAMPHPALWLGRDGAASAGRLGEAALFVLASLGPEGLGAWTPHTQIATLQALRAAGLEAEARALAVETAIAAGL